MAHHPWIVAIIAWATLTVAYSIMQAIENVRDPDGPCWAPVWWIALTWPFMLFVVALDLKLRVTYPTRRSYIERHH